MSLIVYKSSAGSGKTYTLVKEYLLLVIKDPYKYKEILAITFTNKAAAEMKNRILSYLRQIATNSDSSMTNLLISAIKDKTGLSNDIIIQRAETVLSQLLHNYSDFAIGTIDSFAHKIVRTFSYDLFLPINFEVEMNTDNLLSQSVDLLINNVGIDDDLTKILVDYTESKTDDEKNWNIESDLFKFSLTLFKEESIRHIDKLNQLSIKDFIEIKKRISKINKDFENTIFKEASIAYNLIKEKNISNNTFYYTDKGVGKYFENLFKKRIESIEPNSYVRLAFEEDIWLSKKAIENEVAALESIKPQLIEAFNNIKRYKELYYKKYLLNGLINDNLYALTLLHEVKKTLEELKKLNNVVFISDFNKQIADIVLNEPVPYIYERLGERYKNYFIDEFQDTSIIQWQNLLPLIDNSLSEGGLNLIVGDGKQAIYRWRSGEVEQFAKLPKIYGIERTKLIEERENSLQRNYKEDNLTQNFRSSAEIVGFNNSFFEIIKEIIPKSVNSIYDKHQQSSKNKENKGFVFIDFLDKSDDISDTYDDITNNKTLSIINSLIKDGFQYNDIAILCRANKNASSIARFLIKNDINVISSESLLLKSSPEVQFIISCFRYLNNEDDIITVFAIINYLRCNSKFDFPNEINNLTTQKIEKYKIIDIFHKQLQKNNYNFNRNRLIKFMVYELCEEIIRIFKLNHRKDPYIIAFLDNVYRYSTKKTNNLADFIEWWDNENEKLSIVTPEGIDAVQILTIHKAKGLEFPAVIYPYAKGAIRKTKTTAWIDIEKENIINLPTALVNINESLNKTNNSNLYEEEEAKSFLDAINMLYVVFTRPEERLYILSESNEKKTKNSDLPKDISKILTFYLEKTGVYNDTKTTYTFGEAMKHLSKKIKSNVLAQYTDDIISDYIKDKVFVKSILDKTSLNNQFEENILWGNIFHSILSKIYTKEDIEKAVNCFFDTESFPDKYRNTIKIKINQLLSNVLISPYFLKDLKIVNEAELISENGKILRPDRIVFNENTLTIIDYKTGKFNEAHKKQVKEYAKTLESMNYTIDKKLLINISSELVEEVL